MNSSTPFLQNKHILYEHYKKGGGHMGTSPDGFDFIVEKSSHVKVGDIFRVGDWKGNKCVTKCGPAREIPFQQLFVLGSNGSPYRILAGIFLSSPIRTRARYRVEAVLGECCVGKTPYQKFRCVRDVRRRRRQEESEE